LHFGVLKLYITAFRFTYYLQAHTSTFWSKTAPAGVRLAEVWLHDAAAAVVDAAAAAAAAAAAPAS